MDCYTLLIEKTNRRGSKEDVYDPNTAIKTQFLCSNLINKPKLF